MSITKSGTPTTLVPAGNGTPGTASVSFQPGGKISAGAGCNGTNGRYEIDGTTLRVTEGQSTLMGCDPAVEAQDSWFKQFISSGPTLVLAGDTLTLSKDSTVIVFKDRKVTDPDRPLAGPTWTVDTVFGNGGTASSTVGPKPTVVFADDGTLTYDDSCAGGSASWKRTGDQITFSNREANPTAAPCPPSDSREEAALEKTLAGSWTMKIDGPRLDLRRGDEGIGLRADVVPQTVPVTR